MTVSERLFGALHRQFHVIESPLLRTVLLVLLIVASAAGAYALVRMIYFPFRRRARLLRKTFPVAWILLGSPLLPRLLLVVPLLVTGFMVQGLFCENRMAALLNLLVHCSFVFLCAYVFAAAMQVCYRINNWRQNVTASPQKGIFQVLSLIGYLFAVIGIVASLLGKDPSYVLSGLTALSAVLMLIFKDSILGLTAGITLAGNGMVRIGDWIVVPGADADGDVIDIALTTVRVQNFDKTITTIPAYDLVSKPFTNWRGMVDAGGRRIKRSIQIDLDSIRFATEAQLERWQKIDLLRDYLAAKLEEIRVANGKRPTAQASVANARHLTNIGTFRAYCAAYLKHHPGVHQRMTLLVRQLPPAERGIPLEIYCFTNTTQWSAYEAIQSDIFDHLLAILPEFGLSTFQVSSAAALRACSTMRTE